MKAWWGLVLALPAWSHVVSMSSGDLTIEGAHARYELRMPLYEVAHVPHPENALLDHVRFKGARLLSRNCVEDKVRDLYICTAEYDFGSPPDRVDVDCTLSSITVPNHVHMLRAEMGGKHDQGVFDAAFPHAVLRFRPPTVAEVAVTEAGGGFLRALGGPVQILFLAALVLAARSRRELLALAGMFLVGQVAAVLLTPHTAWQPAPRFVEAAAALTVAYLAVEILLLPTAGSRWLVAGVLGIFHGLYFHLFLQAVGYHAGLVLAGAACAEVIVIGMLGLILTRFAQRLMRVPAAALLVFGMVWFVLRLRG